MQKFVQPAYHVQGSRMMDPGKMVYGPAFPTRYFAKKWHDKHGRKHDSVSFETVIIYDTLAEWEQVHG